MKNHYWKIDESGAVVRFEHFSFAEGFNTVQAATKTEATIRFLKRAKAMLENSPKLAIENEAFRLIYHTGECFTVETGPLHRASCPLCIASHDTMEAAEKESSFFYYGSAEYRGIAASNLTL